MVEGFSRRADLERAREVCWLALDGDRMLQRAAKDGVAYVATEPAAGLLGQLRQIVAELDSLPTETKGTKADELRDRREARRSNPDDSVSPTKRAQSRRSNGSHRMG